LAHAYDDLEERIKVLAEQEQLDAMRPDLDGAQIMQILEIKPGPDVGKAYNFLMELRLDEGTLGFDEAKKRLLAWHQSK
jgi:poly(A) polymerase